jgi:hypothetical protein
MTDIQERISAAITRISPGLASMRVPVDQTDPDVVLADAGNEIERLKRELAEAQKLYTSTRNCLAETSSEQENILRGQVKMLLVSLSIILPLAKGYAAEHPMGGHQRYIDHVEGMRASIKEPT